MRPIYHALSTLFLSALLFACGEPGEADEQLDAGVQSDADLVSSSRCSSRVPPFRTGDEGIVAEGEGGKLRARLLSAQPASVQKYLNDWVIQFEDETGVPVEGVAITSARSYMTVHQHDGRVAPMTTPLTDPGRFELSDINLWMGGPWEVQLSVQSPAGGDYLVFHVCVED